jgi:CRP/FNR family cyclic AMP-dependent transcriptional regulator
MGLAESGGETRDYAGGEVVFEEGSVGEYLYVVVSGGVSVRKSGDLVSTVIAEFGPHDMFGELALVDSKPHSARATAVGRTRLRLFDRYTFKDALLDDPELALAVISSLAERLRDTTDKLQRIATQHVLDRAEMALVEKAVLATDASS